ncbi:MAG: methyl-accepting chemotaxis protein [Treponema sp.]|jgi:methyl-accepting chemotaxis protein|nr:methyl-accepting chemotaxis protein [Treponema sp.]
MKIGNKLMIIIISLNLLGIGILVFTLLRLSERQISGLVNSEISTLVEEHALRVRVWFAKYLYTSRNLAQMMAQYEQVDRLDRRRYFLSMLQGIAEANPDITGLSVGWEPDVLDGQDARYRNTPGSDTSGRFVPYLARTKDGIQLESLVDYEIPGEGNYYLQAKQTGRESLMNPYWYPVYGENRLITTITVPITSHDQFVGASIIDIDITAIQEQIQQIKPYEGSVAILFSNDGVVSAHFDDSRLGKSMQETEEDIAGAHLPELMAAVHQGVDFSFTNYVSPLDTDMRFYCGPFMVGETASPWSLMIGIPTRIILMPVYRMLWVSIIIIVVILLLVAAGAFIVARSISKPIKHMVVILGAIREGDMTKRLDIHSNDEMGEMSTSFNTTLDKIQELIMDIQKKAFSLSDMGEDIATAAKEITTTANEQSASVSEIVSTMEGSKNLSAQMAAKTEEVAHLAIETQGLSQKGVDLRDANERMMEGIQNQNSKIIHEIKTLVDMITHINDAIRIIDGIADQTKLIAFNASLEASSSGESGARFSVVASEIRRFADNVVDSTRGIKLKIEEVQTASTSLITEAFSGSQKIEQGYEHMSAQKAVFEGIVETAQNVATRSQQISNLSKQQEYASAQIFEALKEISTGIQQFVVATSSASKVVDSINDMSTELQKAIEKYRTS